MDIVQHISTKGFAILENVFSEIEIENILQKIDNQQLTNPNFRINDDLFAIRCFLSEFPKLKEVLMNEKMQNLVASFGEGYKIVKAIYFDKPPRANWIVNWHQDLTISVKEKVEKEGFTKWLPKGNYYSVQAPQNFLEHIFTVRIHLDDCHAKNGALRVLPESHLEIRDIKTVETAFFEQETICEVKKGGVLLMKPLIWHCSKRTENSEKRRVIHLEFCNLQLPKPLVWAESDEFHNRKI
jgi:hypothetical protein